MKIVLKIILLIFLLTLNAYLVTKVNISDIDIEHFLPAIDSPSLEHVKQNRYLFVVSGSDELFITLKSRNLIKGFVPILGKDNIYLIIFDKLKQVELLKKIAALDYMGTPIVGSLISTGFIQDVYEYLLYFIPLLVPLIVLLTSFRYLLNVINEVLIFSSMMISVIVLFAISLNSAYLLAMLFIFIYVFTLINQVYYNKIETPKLMVSLAASLITTWLSAFLLSISEFGVISDFGRSLMIWIAVLATYLFLRVYLVKRSIYDLKWFTYNVTKIKMKWIGLIVILAVSSLSNLLLSPLSVNLNPLGMSSYQPDIVNFEKSNILSQPILLNVHANEYSFRDIQCNQKLSQLISTLNSEIPLEFESIVDLNIIYSEFSGESFSDVTLPKFAQFKLGLDMSSVESFLYSPDYRNSYFMASVSIMEPISNLLNLISVIDRVSEQSPEFTLEIKGHLANVANYQKIFLLEMFWSIFYIFILLSVLFSLFYRNIRVLVSLLPAFLSIVILMFMHSIFQIDLSVMTLIALILFVGLITDNMIHILIIYKTVTVNCFKTVFKPIILSNIIMVASLLLMAIVNQGFLKSFGLELAILLTIHLVMMVYLLPSLFRYLMPMTSDDSRAR